MSKYSNLIQQAKNLFQEIQEATHPEFNSTENQQFVESLTTFMSHYIKAAVTNQGASSLAMRTSSVDLAKRAKHLRSVEIEKRKK